MSVTRVVLIMMCLAGALAAAPSTVSAQETTFIALGSDPDEVVGHGSDTYFDATTADFIVNRTSGVHRQFITILHPAERRQPDGGPWDSRTAGYAAALVGARHYATETPGYSSAEIGVTAAGSVMRTPGGLFHHS